MRYRKLDANGDFSAGHGTADFFVDQPEAVAQAVLTRLRLWTGEWFLDTAEGTPYREQVLGVRKRQSAGPALRKRIAQTQGLEKIDSFYAGYDGEERALSVSAEVTTVYGEASITEVM